MTTKIDISDWVLSVIAEAEATQTGISQCLLQYPARLPVIAALLGLSALQPEAVLTATCDFDNLPLATVLDKQILPIRLEGILYLVLANPDAILVRSWAQRWSNEHGAILAMTTPEAILARLQRVEEQERAIDQFQQTESESQADLVTEISLSSIAQDQSPVVKLLNSTLFDGLQARASDIHLESIDDGLVVKYRIDGVLQYITQIQGRDFAEQTISRIKVLGGMDIGERRIPQDGRFKVSIQARHVDFRVSVMPSIHGEDAVLRILDKSDAKSDTKKSLQLEALGFDQHTIDRIRNLVKIPHGMVLVTGPTGSGKSTTLYATLSELNSGEEKLITIEDPVEYQLPGILQIPVNDKKGLTFAKGLRSILRHDPDIILVGEIRDAETAGIAVQAALTGHLVLSSVHANGVFSVLERFLYMNVEPASLLEALNGVIAQRLIRRNCPECAQAVSPDDIENHGNVMRGAGCAACRFSGYHGRIALAEILRCSEAFKDAVLQKVPTRALKEIARSEGFVSMTEVAMNAVQQGKTTLQEVHRVIARE